MKKVIEIQKARFSRHMLLALTCFFVSCLGENVQVTIDGSKVGLTFDGIGGLDAIGGLRTLFDYKDPYKSQILDLLFSPKGVCSNSAPYHCKKFIFLIREHQCKY